MDQKTRRLAVLIDAENAQFAILPELLAEIAKIGLATVKRVYGDFTNSALASWREPMLAHSIQPIQQFRNTVHKNASDSALTIDAMDLLHSGRLDAFCIISSDSDFTRLASRIREEGLLAFGFGEQNTPKSFVSACDKFTYTEILHRRANELLDQSERHKHPGDLNVIVPKIVDAIQSCADESGWSFLGRVGSILASHLPDFDPRHYGFAKLSSLMSSLEEFEVEKRGSDDAPQLFVRPKHSLTSSGAQPS